MAKTSSPSSATMIRLILVVGFGCTRYSSGNIPIPDGAEPRAFAAKEAVARLGEGQWVAWNDGPAPIIFPAGAVQRVEVEFHDRY